MEFEKQNMEAAIEPAQSEHHSEAADGQAQAADHAQKDHAPRRRRRPMNRRPKADTAQNGEVQEGEQGEAQETAQRTRSVRARKPREFREPRAKEGQNVTRQPRRRQVQAGMEQEAAANEKRKPAVRKPRVNKESTPVEKETRTTTQARSGGRRGRRDPRPILPVPVSSPVSPRVNARKEGKGRLKIIPLGGLEQIGMNITAFEYEDDIIVVDCGLAFPGDDMLGIDLVIPDVTYLKNNIDRVRAFVITHGHEDHIGALPYILEQINVPVYATKLTMALIEHKLEERGTIRGTRRKVVRYGQTVNLGCFKVEFIRTNHSIQDAAALAIFSPAGIVVHTGDFKIDYTPIYGDPIDLQRFAELGKKGVLALMADSTNALRSGFTMSERTVGKTFENIFAEHANHRIIVATFASNVDRVQQIINTAYKYGRKVVVEGRSMVNVVEIASKLGYINVPEGTLIDIEQLKNYPPESTVLITTGSQGESMAALSRMAASLHKKVTIVPGDVVILSSTPIPGNEKAVANVINELSIKGAEVICQDTHVSGHACQEDLKLIYSLVQPKYAIPIHGEYRHRIAQRDLAQFMGVDKDNTVILNSGDVLAIADDYFQVIDHVPSGAILVDGLGVGDVGNIVLRDRQNLAQNGIIVVVLTLEKRTNQLLSGPDIVSRGFVYVRESEDLLEEAHSVVVEAVDDCLNRHLNDWGRIKTVIKDSLSDFLWKRMKREPVILPIIMEV